MSKIGVICTLYNPTHSCLEKWRKVCNADDSIEFIFVDNTSNPSYLFNCKHYIKLNNNLGIAAAQNIAINKALCIGCSYIVFFDQDSNVSENLIKSLYLEYTMIKNTGVKIAAIGPSLVEINNGHVYKGSFVDNTYPHEKNSIISSGTFTEISVIKDVGVFYEKMFIDLVDHEWCWRARAKGYKIFISSAAKLPHQVGGKTIKIFNIPIIISSPLRYYYQYRNMIWLLKCSYAPKNWKRKILIRRFCELFIVPFFTGNYFKTVFSILKGIKDGVKYNL